MKVRHGFALVLGALLAAPAAHAQARKKKPKAPDASAAVQRPEPNAPIPTDPLAMSPTIAATIGSDYEGRPRPEGKSHLRFYGLFEQRKGDYRFRTLPPFVFEETRGLLDPLHPELGQNPDRQGLYGLLYYQRRSEKISADVLFPLFWNFRVDRSHLTALGPFVHQDSPTGHDNWLAPLFFSGSHVEKEGGRSGYLVIPPLLTFSRWSPESAFTLSTLYFRTRSGSDVDAGVVPFYFHGDNGNEDGARRSYTLIPPLLFYHSWHELDQDSFTVAGPIITSSTPYRSVFDVAPLFFHIHGKPETGGIHESHTTLFPLFHYGYTDDESLLATPLFLYRHTKDTRTIITPLYSRATTRSGSARLELAGPVAPLWVSYVDKDVDQHTWAIVPLFYRNTSRTRRDYLTPLFGRFENIGVSRTYWVFPTITASFDQHGWETDIHPLVYLGRSDQSRHTVFAPIYWDFSDPDKRATVAFPLFWRFADHKDDSVVELVGNSLYTQKRTPDGLSWSFRFLPLFSYGRSPSGYFWDVLLGLVGYEKTAQAKLLKAFWLSFTVGGPDARATAWR
jgi:hypothetical protein